MDTSFEMLVLEQTTSTQDEVRLRAGEDSLLVVAGRQTRGRGRSGAGWDTAPRAVAASLGVRPFWPTSSWPLITLAAGVAVLRALDGRAHSLALKWPNDLMRGKDKLGGILTEAFGDLVVVGWGANLHWPDPPAGRGAVFSEDPGADMAPRLARRWAGELIGLLSQKAGDWPHDEYRDCCSTIGQEITWIPDGRGKAVDVLPEGGLVVTTSGGPVTLTSGAVSEVRYHRG